MDETAGSGAVRREAVRGEVVRSEVVRSEVVTPGPAEALAGLLGVPLPDLDGGEGLPLLWHWLYTLDRPAQADLGRDGHPVRGTVPLPPGPGRRRLWAGGRVRALGPLRVGGTATRRTRVLATEDKRGRSGEFTVVRVGHEVSQDGRVVVEERQDLVYRVPDPGAAGRGSGPPSDADRPRGPEEPPGPDEWALEITPVLLFRFSALTHNGHRIHYDRDYARDVEGYPGLVTHGPLQALVMAEAGPARAGAPVPGTSFDYRLVAPLVDVQGLVARAVTGEDGAVRTAVRDRTGRRTAEGTLTPP